MSNDASVPSPLAPASSPVDFRNRYSFSAWLFLRALALIHLLAFFSFWWQVNGLVGPHGILPSDVLMRAAHEQLGALGFLRLPTLCWWFGGGVFLHVLCAAGVVLSLLLFAGVAPRLSLLLLWVAYLSLVNASQLFLGYQWDALLLETTLLAFFFAPRGWSPRWRRNEPPRVGRLLLGWLLFRLMFLSGVVKLASGDPTWRDLTALTFHYQTQPLPTPLAWYSHHLPVGAHKFSCALMFVIELVAPFLLLAPRRVRHAAATLLIFLQVGIALNGNYAFFNLLTIALCLVFIDDAGWMRLGLTRRLPPAAPSEPKADPRSAWMSASAIFAYTGLLALTAFGGGRAIARPFYPLLQAVSAFGSLNNYGLFAVMTTTRPELIIEGSNDGRAWQAYELPHKPGDLKRAPDFVAPHQPRLDWQLWFAALEAPAQNGWVRGMCEQLLRGNSAVLGLFAKNPFPDRPPRFVRVVRYDYAFTTAEEHERTKAWWKRTPIDLYVEPVSLK